jgi:hypothetical protein
MIPMIQDVPGQTLMTFGALDAQAHSSTTALPALHNPAQDSPCFDQKQQLSKNEGHP